MGQYATRAATATLVVVPKETFYVMVENSAAPKVLHVKGQDQTQNVRR